MVGVSGEVIKFLLSAISGDRDKKVALPLSPRRDNDLYLKFKNRVRSRLFGITF